MEIIYVDTAQQISKLINAWRIYSVNAFLSLLTHNGRLCIASIFLRQFRNQKSPYTCVMGGVYAVTYKII